MDFKILKKKLKVGAWIRTSQYLVSPPFASCSVTYLVGAELIRLLIVECCPIPLQWLCEVASYGRELEHAVNPEHPKNAEWVTCLVSMQSMEELEHFQLPGFVYRSLNHYHAVT